ncbi:CvpA family protein [Apibacter raozihei]|uniref:CvpA family protein n=1 Tax=Apibacter raozihei TaxID=2500547 RepID=UPI000FE31036|nr:CvpA family protein [Apibacter raozihei]
MSFPEYILLGFTFLGVIFGYIRGFLKQISSLLGLILGYLIALFFLGKTQAFFIEYNLVSSQSSTWISFSLTLTLVFLSVKFISRMIEQALRAIGLDFTNKLAGMFLGGLKYFLVIMLVYCFLQSIGILSEKNCTQNLLDFISLFKTVIFLYII